MDVHFRMSFLSGRHLVICPDDEEHLSVILGSVGDMEPAFNGRVTLLFEES